MSRLIVLSPAMLDQSFPRDPHALNIVALSLAGVDELLSDGSIIVVSTSALQDFLLEFDWDRCKEYELLADIHRYLQQIILTGSGVMRFNLDDLHSYFPHPISPDWKGGLVELWQDEVGKLFCINGKCLNTLGAFAIGIAHDRAFSGAEDALPDWPDEALPLVGPKDYFARLVSPYAWEPIDRAAISTPISFDMAKKQLERGVLGNCRVTKPSGGSHYIVRFDGARAWPLDKNLDEIPDDYLRQLIDITGYALPVIRYALIQGRLPNRYFLFDEFVVV